MNIGIIPTLRQPYKNQFEYSIDKNLLKLFSKLTNKKINYLILNDVNNLKNIDLVVICGGNDLKDKSYENKLRYTVSKKIILNAIKLKKKIIGICYGAQLILQIFGSKLFKSNDHVGSHYITLNKKRMKVNSFHNYIVKNIDHKYFDVLGYSHDNSIEYYKSKNSKIIGLMWHPERYKSFKKIDLDIIKNFIIN